MKEPQKNYILIAILLAVFFYLGYSWQQNGGSFASGTKFLSSIVGSSTQQVSYKTEEESDKFVRFDMEVYDRIKDSYWEKLDDDKLSELFLLSLAKAASTTADKIDLPSKNRTGVAVMLKEGIVGVNDEQKKKMTLDIANIALYNLQPAGRSGLLTQASETSLRNNEKNINPEKDLYKDLGLQKGAKKDEIKTAFEDRKAKLLALNTKEAKVELEKVDYARKVLTNDSSKSLYDEAKIEPTVFTRIIGGKTLYLHWNKVSPTTLQEFALGIINASTTPGLNSLIIDIRGNIGGTLDFAKYFMGLFLGQNQYAYDLFHQGDYKVERSMLSKLNELSRYKEIAILVDGNTQSTAELISSAFKRFHLAKIVGTTTRGWGTVENTFPIQTSIDANEKYTVFLVHSITLRDDNQPIEGRGVDPDIDTSKSSWQNKLPQHFSQPEMISALSNIEGKPPMK